MDDSSFRPLGVPNLPFPFPTRPDWWSPELQDLVRQLRLPNPTMYWWQLWDQVKASIRLTGVAYLWKRRICPPAINYHLRDDERIPVSEVWFIPPGDVTKIITKEVDGYESVVEYKVWATKPIAVLLSSDEVVEIRLPLKADEPIMIGGDG